MRIGIPAETRPGETRVAATPETVKKLAPKHEVMVQSGAGLHASVTDEAYAAAGARIGSAGGRLWRRHGAEGARPERGRARLMRPAPSWSACSIPSITRTSPRWPQPPDRLRARSGAAHHARAVDGRAVLAGQHRRLQGRDAGREHLPALHADADDGRRHRQGGARADHGRRRGRPAGDRHRQAPGRRDRSLRRAPARQGAGRVARRQVHRRALSLPTKSARSRRASAAMRARCRPTGCAARPSWCTNAPSWPTSSSPPP
jgi:hypothetical protein